MSKACPSLTKHLQLTRKSTYFRPLTWYVRTTSLYSVSTKIGVGGGLKCPHLPRNTVHAEFEGKHKVLLI